MRLWPWPRQRRVKDPDPKLEEAHRVHASATDEREGAERSLQEARILGAWARETGTANHLAARLEAAFLLSRQRRA